MRAPLTRREIREQREREQAAAKASRRRTSPTAKQRSKRARWIRRGVAIAVVILLIPVAVSYIDYLQRPGSDTMSVKTVEWIRDHGGNGLVNTIERWWYTNNPPPIGGKPERDQGAGHGHRHRHQEERSASHVPADPAARATDDPRGNPRARWWSRTRVCGSRPVASYPGQPAVYTTYVRPDAVHTSYYTALMWLDTKLLRANYIVGLEEPGGGPNPWGSQIPEAERGLTIAAFNSGFKMDAANGGAYLDGETMVPLQDGSATLGDQAGRLLDRWACGGVTSPCRPTSRPSARTWS